MSFISRKNRYMYKLIILFLIITFFFLQVSYAVPTYKNLATGNIAPGQRPDDEEVLDTLMVFDQNRRGFVLYGTYNVTGAPIVIKSGEKQIKIGTGITIDLDQVARLYSFVFDRLGMTWKSKDDKREVLLKFVHAHELGHAFWKTCLKAAREDSEGETFLQDPLNEERFALGFAKEAIGISADISERGVIAWLYDYIDKDKIALSPDARRILDLLFDLKSQTESGVFRPMSYGAEDDELNLVVQLEKAGVQVKDIQVADFSDPDIKEAIAFASREGKLRLMSIPMDAAGKIDRDKTYLPKGTSREIGYASVVSAETGQPIIRPMHIGNPPLIHRGLDDAIAEYHKEDGRARLVKAYSREAELVLEFLKANKLIWLERIFLDLLSVERMKHYIDTQTEGPIPQIAILKTDGKPIYEAPITRLHPSTVEALKATQKVGENDVLSNLGACQR